MVRDEQRGQCLWGEIWEEKEGRLGSQRGSDHTRASGTGVRTLDLMSLQENKQPGRFLRHRSDKIRLALEIIMHSANNL